MSIVISDSCVEVMEEKNSGDGKIVSQPEVRTDRVRRFWKVST